MHKVNKIGVFDSGVSSLTVLKEVTKRLPNPNFIYLEIQQESHMELFFKILL